MISPYVNRIEAWNHRLMEPSEDGTYKQGWATRNLFARTLNIILIPIGLIARVVDITIGIFLALPINTLTLGKIGPLNDYTKECLIQLKTLFSRAYMTALRVINPYAEEDKASLSRYVDKAFIDAARLRENNFFNRQITLRLTSIVYAMAYLVSRVVDTLVGVIMIPLSLATLGAYKRFNCMASQALAFPMIIGDLYACAMRAVMPTVDIRSSAL